MSGKYNPFRPDKAAPPGMFAGRTAEIDYIQGCLRQTKSGNPKHFMITGERGIGKSSLVLVEQLSARGKISLDGHDFKFIVISTKLRKEDSFYDIIERVSRELKREIDKLSQFGSFILNLLNFCRELKLVDIEFTRRQTITTRRSLH